MMKVLKPVFSIAAVADSVVESNSAQFRLTTPTTSTIPVTVKVNISHTDNVGVDIIADESGNMSIRVPANTAEKIFDVRIRNDNIDELDGEVKGKITC